MSPRDEPGGGDHVWIFGYGSLMWRPGFEAVERVPAAVQGWRRAFCIYSTHHRGCDKRPGLVLALDRGGACRGMAFRVAPHLAAATLAYLRAREQVNGVYREARCAVRLKDGSHRQITAIAYVAERAHPSYAGHLPIARQVDIIRGARGLSGTNIEYLVSTLCELRRQGVHEPELERIVTRIGPHLARESWAAKAAPALIAASRRHRIAVPLMTPSQRRRFAHRRQIAEWALAAKA